MADGGAKRLTALLPFRLPGVLAGMAMLLMAAASGASGTDTPKAATKMEPQPVSPPADPGHGGDEIRNLREQIVRAPDDALLQVRLGYLLLSAGALTEAKTAFDEGLKLNKHSHAAMTGEGILLARAGNLKEAEQVLKAALVRNPNPVRTHYELGRVYEALGDLDKALAEYKEGITKFRQGRK